MIVLRKASARMQHSMKRCGVKGSMVGTARLSKIRPAIFTKLGDDRFQGGAQTTDGRAARSESPVLIIPGY